MPCQSLFQPSWRRSRKPRWAAHRGFRLLLHDGWNSDWHGIAAMARITRHITAPVEIIFVDCEHHLHHLACGLFRFLIVFIKLILHMSEFAVHSQRRGDELHRGKQLLRRNSFEHLNILELLLCFLWRLAGSSKGCAGMLPRMG